MKKTVLFAFVLFSTLIVIQSCDKTDIGTSTDQELYDMATETGGFTWYKFSDTLLAQSGISGHQEAFLRTRYNAVAATKLDSIGKVTEGITFDEGSLIVKELINTGTTVATYAIMYKDSDNDDADSNGWVWGYVNGDATIRIPASDKGSACRGCHASSGNIDGALMNVAFP